MDIWEGKRLRWEDGKIRKISELFVFVFMASCFHSGGFKLISTAVAQVSCRWMQAWYHCLPKRVIGLVIFSECRWSQRSEVLSAIHWKTSISQKRFLRNCDMTENPVSFHRIPPKPLVQTPFFVATRTKARSWCLFLTISLFWTLKAVKSCFY